MQIALDRIEAPLRSLALHHLTSGKHYQESAISPYLWVNGAPPQGVESPKFSALADDGFRAGVWKWAGYSGLHMK
ncbi:MAG: hypothetical protein ACR2NB_13520 [Solirubrobacteraceae bacterium]